MTNKFTTTIKATMVAGAILLSGSAFAADYKLDISLETAPTNIVNESMTTFAEKVKQRTNGRLAPRVFHSASKYDGSDVATALAQGALDMGVVLNVHLAKFLPDANIVQLPMFYGLKPETMFKVLDGKVGQTFDAKLAKKLDVKVLGNMFGVYVDLYTTDKQISKPQDLKGMKFRIAGGAAAAHLFKTIGANPVSISHADLPQALQRGTVKGLVSHQKSYRSSKYHEVGVKYALIDNGVFYFYAPLISKKAWNSYPKDIQDILVKTWNETVIGLRANMAAEMDAAQAENAKNGLITTYAKESDLNDLRNKLLKGQDALVKEIRMDPAFVEMAKQEINKLK